MINFKNDAYVIYLKYTECIYWNQNFKACILLFAFISDKKAEKMMEV
jgi:hypothetical protein